MSGPFSSYNKKRFSVGVGRLVYHLFVNSIDFKKDRGMICHKDDDDLNNHVSNLVLLSCSDKQRLSFSRKRQRSHLKILILKSASICFALKQKE